MSSALQRLARATIVVLALAAPLAFSQAANADSSTAPAATAAPASLTPLTPDGSAMSGRHVTRFTTTLTKQDDSGTRNGVQEVITCSGTISTPVVQDVPGFPPETTVNTFCDSFVDSITVRAVMLRNGAIVDDQVATSFSTSSASVTATVLCLATINNYQGFGEALFVKAGYVGSPLYLAGFSPVVSGSC